MDIHGGRWQPSVFVGFTMFYHTAGLGPCGMRPTMCASVKTYRPDGIPETPLRENGQIKMILNFSLLICDGLNTMV